LLETVFPLIFFDSKKMKNLLMNRSDIYEIIALLYNVFDWKIISKCDPLVAFEIRWFFFIVRFLGELGAKILVPRN
jgi:hypothetical protein